MFKIKDRVALGVFAGLCGNLTKTEIDELSYHLKIFQRSFRETASGVWVSKKQSRSVKGQILGGMLDFGMGIVGGIGTVYLLSKTGRDKLMVKGLVSGVTLGSTITAFVSAFPQNRVRPKEAASNLKSKRMDSSSAGLQRADLRLNIVRVSIKKRHIQLMRRFLYAGKLQFLKRQIFSNTGLAF